MTRFDYIARGVLYFLIAAIPVIQTGIGSHQSLLQIALGTILAGAVALRAYIDRSASEQDTTQKAQEASSDITS